MFCRLYLWNLASELLQIGCKLEKCQWRYNFMTWGYRKFFWPHFIFLVNFSYWSKFHVNIITGSGVITIFFYKRLIRNPEIRNTPIWVLPNIWRLGPIKNTKFGTNIFNKMLLNVAKRQGYSFHHFWVIKGKPTGGIKLPPAPRSGLR